MWAPRHSRHGVAVPRTPSEMFKPGTARGTYAEAMTLAFNFIGIVTRDLGASLAFYRQLGLDIPEGQDDAPHVEVGLPGGLTLAWDPLSTIQGFNPDFAFPEGPGRVSFACEAGSVTAVDQTYAEIVAADPGAAHTAPWDAPWGQRYSTVRDPDGNTVDLYAALPATSEAPATPEAPAASEAPAA